MDGKNKKKVEKIPHCLRFFLCFDFSLISQLPVLGPDGITFIFKALFKASSINLYFVATL